jgi:hypothetical protein
MLLGAPGRLGGAAGRAAAEPGAQAVTTQWERGEEVAETLGWKQGTALAARSIASPRPDHSVGVWDDNHRYHWNGGPAMPSVTGVIRLQDALMGGDGLTNWAAGIAADYVLVLPHQSDPLVRALYRQQAVAAVGAASRRGSAVHGQIADILTFGSTTITPTAEAAPYVYAFSMFLAEHRPEFIHSEQVVLSPSHGFGGRFDFIAKIGGRVSLVDIKTGKLKASHRLQLAGYAAADFIGKPDDEREYPLPRIKDFYVLLLREGSYELVSLPVTSYDRKHFLQLTKTYHAAKAWEGTTK